MPNEPVQCPNCGGGDVRQLAPIPITADCQTTFIGSIRRDDVAHKRSGARRGIVCLWRLATGSVFGAVAISAETSCNFYGNHTRERISCFPSCTWRTAAAEALRGKLTRSCSGDSLIFQGRSCGRSKSAVCYHTPTLPLRENAFLNVRAPCWPLGAASQPWAKEDERA